MAKRVKATGNFKLEKAVQVPMDFQDNPMVNTSHEGAQKNVGKVKKRNARPIFCFKCLVQYQPGQTHACEVVLG